MLRQIKDLKAPLLDKNGQDDDVGTIVWIEESNNDPSKTQKKRKKDVFNSRFFKAVACCLLFVLFNLAIFTKQEQQVKPLRKGFGGPTTNQADIVITTDSREDGQLPIGDKDYSSNAEIDDDYDFKYDDVYDVHDDVFGGYDDLTTEYNDMVDDGSGDSMLKSEQNSAFQENLQKEDEIYKIDRSIAMPDELEEGFGLLGSKGTFKQNEEREKKKELDYLNRTQDEVNSNPRNSLLGVTGMIEKTDEEKAIEQNTNLVKVTDDSGKVYYMDTKTKKIISDLPNTKNINGDSSIEGVETPTHYDFVNTPRCGATWEDANNHCYGSCQSDNDCYQERKCFFDLANDCPSVVDLPMSGRLSFIEDIGKVKSHWNMPLDKWNFCCGEGHYCSTCYGQSCCTGEPKCCQFGDDYDAECCSKAPGRCYWNECKPCPAGTYSPVGGHYAHVPGYTCPPCPPGTTSEEGATECYPDVRTEVLSDGGEEDYEPSGGNGEDDGVGALEDEVSATEPSDGGEEDYELEFLGGESATGAMGNMASVGDAEYAGGLFGSDSMSADEYSSENNANLLGESLTDEPDNFMKLSDLSGNIYYANMETKQIVLDKERDRKNELEFLSDGEDKEYSTRKDEQLLDLPDHQYACYSKWKFLCGCKATMCNQTLCEAVGNTWTAKCFQSKGTPNGCAEKYCPFDDSMSK